MTDHTPGPIADNPIYVQLQRAEQMLAHVYEGRLPALILYGPPGIGKSSLGHKVAKAHQERWRPERPGTPLGLVNVLHQNRNGGVVAFDDIDLLWDDGNSLDVLKVALDTKDSRVLSHTVGGSKKNSLKRFEIKCGAVFLSNRNFRDPRDFNKDLWKSGIAAVKDRSMVVGLDFDPLACYEYTGWLATEGGMLSKLSIDLKVGSTILGKSGGPVIITHSNRHRSLTLAEANDVLEHFAKHAARYPSVGPRDLYKFARLRIGADKLQWEGWVEEQLEPQPKWKFEKRLADGSTVKIDDLFQYRIGLRGAHISAEGSPYGRPFPEGGGGSKEPPKVKSADQVRDVVAKIRGRLQSEPPEVKSADQVHDEARAFWEKAQKPDNEPEQATEYDPAICGVRYIVKSVGGVTVHSSTWDEAARFVTDTSEIIAQRSTNYSELAKRREAAATPQTPKAAARPQTEEPPKKRRGRPPKAKPVEPAVTPQTLPPSADICAPRKPSAVPDELGDMLARAMMDGSYKPARGEGAVDAVEDEDGGEEV
jgi:hypothetical protein